MKTRRPPSTTSTTPDTNLASALARIEASAAPYMDLDAALLEHVASKYQRSTPASLARYKSKPYAHTTIVCLTQPAFHGLYTAAQQLDYIGNSRDTGLTAYIEALFQTNPTPADWSDNRPNIAPNLTDNDRDARLLFYLGRLPIWHDEDSIMPRLPRRLLTRRLTPIIPYMLTIARHYGISYNNRNTTPTLINSLLEAVGLSYLIPATVPPRCPKPVNPHRKLRKQRDLYTSAVVHSQTEKEFHW